MIPRFQLILEVLPDNWWPQASMPASAKPQYDTPEGERFFTPRPGFCVRTTDARDPRTSPATVAGAAASGSEMSAPAGADTPSILARGAAGVRIYINLCQHEQLPPPKTPDNKPVPPNLPPQLMRIPLAIGPLRRRFPPTAIGRSGGINYILAVAYDLYKLNAVHAGYTPRYSRGKFERRSDSGARVPVCRHYFPPVYY